MERNDDKIAITIGRQFGSGGGEIGRLVAERLGYNYYDKELILKAARESGISTALLANADERTPSFVENLFAWTGISSASIFSGNATMTLDNLYMLQSSIIRKIADESSCVIVGRSAEYALRHHQRLLSVFIYADIDRRIERIMARQPGISPSDAEQLAHKNDRLRANYYDYYTDKRWGQCESYDLSINSGTLGIDVAVQLIIDTVGRRFGGTALSGTELQ